jgi:hypothetical protein
MAAQAAVPQVNSARALPVWEHLVKVLMELLVLATQVAVAVELEARASAGLEAEHSSPQ